MNAIGTALVGFGRWGQNLARAIGRDQEFRLVAICDIDGARCRAAESLDDAIAISQSLQAVLRIPAVDALVIATPPSALAAIVREAIECRKHAFIEKPAASTAGEAAALAGLAKARGLVSMVDCTPAYSPLTDEMRDAIDGGHIGRLLRFSAKRTNADGGQPGVNVLRDLAIHDVARMAELGLRPRALRARGTWRDGALSGARLEFDCAGEVCAVIEAGWWSTRQRHTRLTGSDRRLSWDEERERVLRDTPDEPVARALAHFAVCVSQKLEPRTSLRRTSEWLGWLEAAERSMASAGLSVSLAAKAPA